MCLCRDGDGHGDGLDVLGGQGTVGKLNMRISNNVEDESEKTRHDTFFADLVQLWNSEIG